MTHELAQIIKHELTRIVGVSVEDLQIHPVGGGSINQTFQLQLNHSQRFFCKINSAGQFPYLFDREKSGLEILAAAAVIRIPKIIACELIGDQQILILEWIVQGLKTENCWKKLGEQLAQLHHCTHHSFGLEEDNYMGALHQCNSFCASWNDFFIQQRLVPQVKLATDRGLMETKHARQFDNLYKRLPTIFPIEQPALLHGDLWSGNFLADEAGSPVLIDPAVYYGHRCIDLAMTTLFGGFGQSFYASYHYHFPFPENYRVQWDVCNLYPLLVHLNIFGRGYLRDILAIIESF